MTFADLLIAEQGWAFCYIIDHDNLAYLFQANVKWHWTLF